MQLDTGLLYDGTNAKETTGFETSVYKRAVIKSFYQA